MSNRAYIANAFEQTISIINTDTNAVIGTINLGSTPLAVAVNDATNTTRIYVTASGGTEGLFVIDTCDNSVIAVIPIDNPLSVAVTPDQSKIYVTHSPPGEVVVVDANTNTIITTISVGVGADGLAITSSGKAYVAGSQDDTIYVIDTATDTVITTIPAASIPEGVAVNPSGTRAYVTNFGANSVSVIDTTSDTIIATIPVGIRPLGIVVTPDGLFAYVANSNSSTVSVIDLTSNTVIVNVLVSPALIEVGLNDFVTINETKLTIPINLPSKEYGPFPTGTVAITVLVVVSITDTLSLPAFVI